MTNQVTFLFSFFIAVHAAISDMKSRKVTNKFLLSAFVVGILLRVLFLDEVADCLMGMLIPFIALLIPYLLGAFGASDIKLLMVLGLVLGRERIKVIIIVSIFIGGIIGVFVIIKKLLSRTINKRVEIPFAVAILMADLIVLLC